jgi:hypothetical protein
MKIEFKRWDGQGDPHDPKIGVPMSVTLESILALLRGRVIAGAGGVSTNTESFQIFLSDGPTLWFVTTQGRPRILFQDNAPK